jgi:hypothetical protein
LNRSENVVLEEEASFLWFEDEGLRVEARRFLVRLNFSDNIHDYFSVAHWLRVNRNYRPFDVAQFQLFKLFENLFGAPIFFALEREKGILGVVEGDQGEAFRWNVKKHVVLSDVDFAESVVILIQHSQLIIVGF